MKSVTIGADPEFIILKPDNNPIPAYALCDDYDYHNTFGIEIGQNRNIFELRLAPAKNVFTIIANIRKLLKINIDKIPRLKECKFIGGHTVSVLHKNFKIGGHIHIGISSYHEQLDLRSDMFEDFINKIIYDGLMNIINDKKGHAKRRRAPYAYGKPNHFVEQKYGIEYKTPPSWLVNPTLAFMFLTLAKICGLIFCNKEAWGLETYIKDIINNKSKGLILLNKLLILVEAQPEMMHENDIARCIELLHKLPKTIKVISWQQDFKKAWQL